MSVRLHFSLTLFHYCHPLLMLFLLHPLLGYRPKIEKDIYLSKDDNRSIIPS